MLMSNKNNLDQYWTKLGVCEELVKHVRLIDYNWIIEPSVGCGNFVQAIANQYNETEPYITNKIIAIDIDTDNINLNKLKGVSVTETDYISWCHSFQDSSTKNDKGVVIGNPPFGKRNKMARAFLTSSFKLNNVELVAFILPNTFKKHTNQTVIPQEWRIKKIVDIPSNSFITEGRCFNIPASFFVFEKSEGPDLRFNPLDYQSSTDFEFCSQQDADWFVFGAAPTVLIHPEERKENHKGYFIRSKGIDKMELKRRFQTTYWYGQSTANGGVYWLTKPELIKCYRGE